jgi:signal transduction histidine kinase
MVEAAVIAPLAAADILVVDDAPENLKILMGMLTGAGCRVRPAPNGPLALRAAREAPPDLILLDIQMPAMDGFEVCRQLKRDERLAEIPVIFLSAFTDPATKVRAFEAGGVDYVSKPFSVDEVLARVGTHLKLVRGERELRRSYRELQEAERLRDSLVHMLVHDLRSPLQALALFLPSLAEQVQAGLEPVWQARLDKAQGAIDRLIQMVSEVLDVSRLEAGQMPLVLEALDLAQVAREALDHLQPLAGQRELRLEADGRVTAWGDRRLVFRIFQNLLGNALKFTPDGGQVRVLLRQEGPWAGARVEDDGSGIPLEAQARVFEKFGQAGAETAWSTGLGLPFCRLAVTAQGGRMGLESEPGRGSRFWFRLPVPPEPSGTL